MSKTCCLKYHDNCKRMTFDSGIDLITSWENVILMTKENKKETEND